MSIVQRILCGHDYQSMSLHAGEELLIKKCRRCGKRVEQELSAASGGEPA